MADIGDGASERMSMNCRSELLCGDNLDVLKDVPDKAFDLTFCSPPYVDCRTYGIGFKLTGQDWVDWAVARFVEHLRVTKGLVAWVIEGKTKKFRWDATPALLMADLHRRGVHLRKPPAFARVGIPGSGGPDWLRNDYEFIVCATNGGKLPWSDNTACGHPPVFPAGGNPSHQSRDGRVNRPRPQREGDKRTVRTYAPPAKANPGNVIQLHGGGGHMGHKLAHENEAPFPLKLAEFFVKSFCPPGGRVLDPFCGSGTTGHAALIHGRQFTGIDVRDSQIELTRRRLETIQPSPATDDIPW